MTVFAELVDRLVDIFFLNLLTSRMVSEDWKTANVNLFNEEGRQKVRLENPFGLIFTVD